MTNYINFIAREREYTASQNLGQQFNGIPKYKSKDSEGNPTGVGYAFEDLYAKKLRESGHHVVKLPEDHKNGADFLVDGTPVQTKCCSTGVKTGRAFFQNFNHYKYTDQTPVVPSDQKAKVDVVFKRMLNNGSSCPAESTAAPVSRQEAIDYYQKGIKSFWMDAMDLTLQRYALAPAIAAGLIAVTATIVINKINKKPTSIKRAAKIGITAAVVMGVSSLALMCFDRQKLRE